MRVCRRNVARVYFQKLQDMRTGNGAVASSPEFGSSLGVLSMFLMDNMFGESIKTDWRPDFLDG